MKRFYKETAVEQAEDGFRVLLDGKPMRTPAKAVLIVPTKPLADAIAAEWGGVPDKAEINAAHLPLTRLAATGLDRVVPGARRSSPIPQIRRSDLLCYRPRRPAVKLQHDAGNRCSMGRREVRCTADRRGGIAFVDQPGGNGMAARRRLRTPISPCRRSTISPIPPDRW
jgi:hypothetical protein